MPPLFSVIICAYNSGKYLESCLDSIFCQECSDAEICLINDGSTDNTLEIAYKYLKFPNFCIYNIDHKGQGAARNFALKQTSGKWISFIDSDDTVTNAYFQILREAVSLSNEPVLKFGFFVKNNKNIFKIDSLQFLRSICACGNPPDVF